MLSLWVLSTDHVTTPVTTPSAAELEAWLEPSVRAAEKAWPTVRCDAQVFRAYLASKVAALTDPSSFRRLKTSDLYLVCACERHDKNALAAFEECFMPQISRALARMKFPVLVAGDIRGELWEKLFVPPPGTKPLTAEYSGRGDLGGWVRSIAVHAAFKLRAKDAKNTTLDEADGILGPEGDPELSYVKRLYTSEFNAALDAAMTSLNPRERNLLRQHYLDGLSADALGKLYRVHRATTTRWMTEVRTKILSRMREHLALHLQISKVDLDSLLRLVQSQIDLSISRILGRGAA